YQVFDGLLFWDGGADGGERGASWLSPRKAFRETGIVRLNVADVVVEGFHLKYDDDPDTGTRLAGGRLEFAAHDWIFEHAKLGLMVFDIYESKTASRDGLNVVYGYQEATPLRALPDLGYTASYVWEQNSHAAGLVDAVGWTVAPTYQASRMPWKP